MLVAVRIDADRRHQGHILVYVNAVDLDHQQIEAGKIGRHPFLQPRRRQRDKMPGSRRSRQACPLWRRHVALGQAHRPSEPARRDVDQHLVHRPFAEPVFALRGLPTGKSLLLAVEAAKPGTRHLDLAAVETDLALRLAPAMRLAPTTPFMALAAGRQRVLLHHLGERLEPCRKAEPLEARRHARQRLGFNRIRGNRGRCAKFLHGVASFRGISTPSLTAQGEQRRSSIFNNDRDIPAPQWAARRFFRQVRVHLSQLAATRRPVFSAFDFALCEQLASTLARLKDEPALARDCLLRGAIGLSSGWAIERLATGVDTNRQTAGISGEISRLLAGLSRVYLRPSWARLTRSAWDARVVSRRLLAKARAADKPTDSEALLVLAMACEALRSNLLRNRLFVREEQDVLRS